MIKYFTVATAQVQERKCELCMRLWAKLNKRGFKSHAEISYSLDKANKYTFKIILYGDSTKGTRGITMPHPNFHP